jgi:hypothetical protein
MTRPGCGNHAMLKDVSHLILSHVQQLQMFETGASHTRSHVGGGPATGCHKPALGQGSTPLSFAVLTSCCCAVLQVCFLCFCRQNVAIVDISPTQLSRRNSQHDPAQMITVELLMLHPAQQEDSNWPGTFRSQ